MVATGILLVEGKDEVHVVQHLLVHHQVPEVFAIEDGYGIDRVLESLPVRLEIGAVKRLGIIVDADAAVESRWQALRDILLRAGYDEAGIPTIPDPQGTVVVQDNQRVPIIGIWIMPDNTVPGMLENFIGSLVRPDDALWSRAIESVDQLPEYRFPAAHKPKAYVYTWLAWQEKPGLPMGLAIKAQYLQADAPHAQQLIAWLRRLFVLNMEESPPPAP